MKVFQFTAEKKQNLFFEPDRPHRFYGYSLLIIESRSNLTIGLFILWMDYWINNPNHFSIYEFISPLATGTLDTLWLFVAQILEHSSGTRQVCVSVFSDHCIMQIDSMLPWICSVIDHRGRQNVIKDISGSCATCLFFYHILTSSVIYHWTDARQHGICLLNSKQVPESWLIRKFRISRRPWELHDCEANAGQLLFKNKNKHR